ncbi:MAG TPA: hypothetical protein VGG64_24605 [Pirellulales bacterium]|jgi:hypothetical protein
MTLLTFLRARSAALVVITLLAVAWFGFSERPALAKRSARGSLASNAPRWHVTETLNFRIYSFATHPLDPHVAAHCEDFRAQVSRAWLVNDHGRQWSPKCTIVMHATEASYRSVVGALADCTVAACTIEAIGEQTASRRIDVCTCCENWLAYLPHELTHVLLDGRLTTGGLARWADEGMSLVADPPGKRAAHDHDLRQALAEGRQFRVIELLALTDYPARDRLGVFYGQSQSIVEFLVHPGGRHKFIAFAKSAARNGYDSALRTSYGIDNAGALEVQWLAAFREVETR